LSDRGRLAQSWNPCIRPRSSPRGISWWRIPEPAVIHWTSPEPSEPRFPRLSPCCTVPLRTYVIVSIPPWGCHGNTARYSSRCAPLAGGCEHVLPSAVPILQWPGVGVMFLSDAVRARVVHGVLRHLEQVVAVGPNRVHVRLTVGGPRQRRHHLLLGRIPLGES